MTRITLFSEKESAKRDWHKSLQTHEPGSIERPRPRIGPKQPLEMMN
jgi:hypothetical protein